MKKQNRLYRIALIYKDFVSDTLDFNTTDYEEAYIEAGKQMKKDKLICSVLVYSSEGKQLVLKSQTVVPYLEGKNLI